MKSYVYTSGQDGYDTYRIPSILRASNGDLLAICEGRRNSPRDHGDIDLLIKRSTDDGETWSDQQVIYGEEGDITIGNPCPVLDRETGVIWLPFCRDNKDVLVASSSDNGDTWSAPVDMSGTCSHPDWDWYATGPGVGIQLTKGPNKGRLVIPCDHRTDGAYGNGSHTIYSGDHGETWHLSELITPGANECQVAELSDGRLMMNIRMQTYSQGLRGVALSGDGGGTWSDIEHDAQLPCSKCQGSLIGDGEQLLFSNPVPPKDPSPDKGDRVNLVVKQSKDDGRTWESCEKLHAGPAAYSSLVFLGGGQAACLFEGGQDEFREHLVFSRFTV